MPDKPKFLSILDSLHQPEVPEPVPEDGADSTLTGRELEYELQRREQIIREKNDEIQRHREEHGLRKRYVSNVFFLICAFLFLVLAIVVFTGIGWLRLSDTVIVTLLTTTSASVIGILLIAFKWLFPDGKK